MGDASARLRKNDEMRRERALTAPQQHEMGECQHIEESEGRDGKDRIRKMPVIMRVQDRRHETSVHFAYTSKSVRNKSI